MSFTATSKNVLSESKRKFIWITRGSLVDNRYIWRTGRKPKDFQDIYF
jgi:hypothetical protein